MDRSVARSPCGNSAFYVGLPHREDPIKAHQVILASTQATDLIAVVVSKQYLSESQQPSKSAEFHASIHLITAPSHKVREPKNSPSPSCVCDIYATKQVLWDAATLCGPIPVLSFAGNFVGHAGILVPSFRAPFRSAVVFSRGIRPGNYCRNKTRHLR